MMQAVSMMKQEIRCLLVALQEARVQAFRTYAVAALEARYTRLLKPTDDAAPGFLGLWKAPLLLFLLQPLLCGRRKVCKEP
jgi:hypothetical protein